MTTSLSARPDPRPWILAVVAGGIGLATLASSIFVVAPTDVAFRVRLGRVYDLPEQPLLSGPHLKLPFIDRVDHLRVSLDTATMPQIKVFSRDSQPVDIQMSMTYRVPVGDAYRLLYGIGRTGPVDIDNNLFKVAADRTNTVFGRQDLLAVAANRQQVLDEIKRSVTEDLRRLFGIEVADMQLIKFEFSPAFTTSLNVATTAKNEVIKAQAELQREQIVAQKVVVVARAAADSAIEDARGKAEAQVRAAEAAARATRLDGEAQAAAIAARGAAEAGALRAQIEAAGGADAFVRQTQARAQLNWRGEVPQTLLGQGGVVPVFSLGQAK